jgi:hypothetical protein
MQRGRALSSSGQGGRCGEGGFEPPAAAKACHWPESVELERAGKPHRDVSVKLIVEIAADGTVTTDRRLRRRRRSASSTVIERCA